MPSAYLFDAMIDAILALLPALSPTPGAPGSEPPPAPAFDLRVQKVAVDAYRALRVRDYGRVDLRMAETGEIYVLEVNASCYLEKESEFALAAAKFVERTATGLASQPG